MHLAAPTFWQLKKIDGIGRIMAKSIQEIRQEFAQAQPQDLEKLIQLFEQDSRKGVQSLLQKAQKTLEKFYREQERLEKMRIYERKYEAFPAICGVDEAGRGPLAGPVVAGAVILPKDCSILYLNDSKQVSAARREKLFDEIQEKAVAHGVGIVSAKRIDEINILQATYEAMRLAIEALGMTPDFLLADAVTIPGIAIKQEGIVKGDAKSVSIAAASILAKVTRDRMMLEYDTLYPEYGFASHKGYGTQAHIAAIREYGPCRIHRKTFIHNFVNESERYGD